MATGTKAGSKGSAGGRLVAVASWCVAVWTTSQFLAPLTETPAEQLMLWAALLQAIATWGESPIWRGAGRWWHYAILALDTVTNVGGLFFFVTRVDQTDSWQAFNAGLGLSGGLAPVAALLLSIVLGILLAAAPEFLWRQG